MEFHVDSTVYSGIPENKKDRLPVEQRTYELLESLGISFARLDHDAAYTIDACAALAEHDRRPLATARDALQARKKPVQDDLTTYEVCRSVPK